VRSIRKNNPGQNRRGGGRRRSAKGERKGVGEKKIIYIYIIVFTAPQNYYYYYLIIYLGGFEFRALTPFHSPRSPTPFSETEKEKKKNLAQIVFNSQHSTTVGLPWLQAAIGWQHSPRTIFNFFFVPSTLSEPPQERAIDHLRAVWHPWHRSRMFHRVYGRSPSQASRSDRPTRAVIRTPSPSGLSMRTIESLDGRA